MDQSKDGNSSSEIQSPRRDRERIYTVDDAINKIGFGPFQILITVFCGMLWLTDAMELMILSILSPIVKCQWELSSFEEAMITSIVFVGFFLGGFSWGIIFDKIGRKRGLFIVNVVLLVFGGLSALKLSPEDSRIPGYPWLLLCRFGVGFGAGGTGQAVTYYAEFLPLKGRGIYIVLIEVWWAIGSMLGPALAIVVFGEGGLGWHWYLGLAALPLGLVLVLFFFVPESARFYLVQGKPDKAQKVLKRVAWMNRKEMPLGRVVSLEEKDRVADVEDVVLYSKETVDSSSHVSGTSYEVSNNQTSDLLQRHCDSNDGGVISDESPLLDASGETPLLDDVDISEADGKGQGGTAHQQNGSSKVDSDKTPLLEITTSKKTKLHNVASGVIVLFSKGMWRTTVILMCLWFGVAWLYYGIVLLTTTLLQYDPHCNNNISNTTNLTTCEEFDTGDYVKILWTAAAELPGVLVTVVLIDIVGRKWTMAVEFVGCMVGFLLLFICASDTLLTFFLFLIRAFATGAFQAIYVYTPEIYATSSRALAMGICSSIARIGAIVTPYVAQVLLHVNGYLTLSLYASTSLALAVLAMLLPIETKGRALHDVRH